MTSSIGIPNTGNTRVFVQEDGPSPANGYNYHGTLNLGGVSENLGDLSPIQIPSSEVHSTWDNVGINRGEPGLPTTDFTARLNKLLASVWWRIRRTKCAINMQIKIDTCGTPDDFNSWESKFLLSRNHLTSITGPPINPLTGGDNTPADLTGSLTMLDWYELIPIRFQEKADTVVVAEVLDGIYADSIQCGNCGVQSDGCNKAYFLTLANAGSPGLSSQIVYTTDDLATFSTIDIPTLGGVSGTRMARVGARLVVISENSDSHHHILFTDLEAGAASAWSEISTGYVAGGSPRAIYVKSTSEVFIVGEGGYAYKMTSPTSAVTVIMDGSLTSQNFNDIDGSKAVIVAVGNSNALVVSVNRGTTFVSKTGPKVGVNLNAIEVINEDIWFVATADGELYYTLDGGDTWTLSLSDGLDAINDIRFFDENVGYLVAQIGGQARVYRTDTMGNSWHYQGPWISGLPDVERINFAFPCGPNEVIGGGRVSAGGDGLIVHAQ